MTTPSPALTAAPSPSAAPATATPTAAATASAVPSTPSPAPTPSPSKGPASGQFTLAGSSGLAGAVTVTQISCYVPSFNGPQISILGKFASGPDFVLFVTAGHIEARVGSGSGVSLKLRTFEGTGVTSFDGAIGAQLDSDLVETTEPGTAVGNLGALTHITGTVDCGNQQPGTAAIVVSGPFAAGPLAGALTEPKVTCTVTSSATFVNISGLGMAGSTPAIVFVNASAAMLQVVVYSQGAATSEVYSAAQPGAFTLTPDGVQVSADVSLNTPAGASPGPSPAPMLHVEGSATCGQTLHQ